MIKLFKFLKPYKIPTTLVLVFLFFQSLAELYLPTLMSDIVDIGIVNGDVKYIVRVGGFMLLVAVVSSVCTVLASLLSAKTAAGFGKDLREKVFTRVESFSLQEFDKIGTASLITRTTNDITQLQQVLIMFMRMMVSAPMMFIGGIIMAVSKDAKLSLILVVVIPVLSGFIYFISHKSVPLFKAMQSKLDKLNLVLRENLTGIRVIRAFNRIDWEKKRFKGVNRDLTDTAVRVNQLMAFLLPVMMLMMNLTTVAIIWLGGIRIERGDMQVGDMMAFVQYVTQIMFSVFMVSFMLSMLPRAQVSAARINEVLDTEPEITDPPKAKGATRKGYLEFKDVSFSYPGAEYPVLSNISFVVEPGEVTAVIGGTGSGKSTLINLILRFYDVDSGSILVDGVDIRELSQENLRSKIGYVSQSAVLFTGTVAENIKYGKEDATDEEIRKAAETAQAMEFISGMKNGFDTVIAQGGKNLSGGQKQRIAIARALVRRPEIYIFDDSFSALDFKTDAVLRAELKKEIADSIVLVVAQRVSTVMDANRILVLDRGKIVGSGKHGELLNNCEVYREIVASQLPEEESA